MFIEKFCPNPSIIKTESDLDTGVRHYDDSILEEYESIATFIDKFIILADMIKIVESCSIDFLTHKLEYEQNFWLVNKLLLNYTNAAYSFQECASKFDTTVRRIFDKYMKSQLWSPFIISYRMLMVHHSDIMKYYDPTKNDVFICIEEEQKKINRLINRASCRNHKPPRSLEKLNAYFTDAIPYSKEDEKSGKHYLSVKPIIEQSSNELVYIGNSIIDQIFQSEVIKRLERLISLVVQQKGTYCYTFLVNEVTRLDCEPNLILEEAFRRMLITFGSDSKIGINLIDFFRSKNYTFFYDQNANIDTLINLYGLHSIKKP